MYRCVAMIDGAALLHNLAVLKKMSDSSLIIMVKANAYGHGLKEIAESLKNEPVTFGVAAIDEALILRKAGVKNSILLFDGGASFDQSDLLVSHAITPVVTESRTFEYLEAALKDSNSAKKKIHLKIDTGFTRLGLNYDDILQGLHDEFFKRVRESSHIELEGVATHFCRTDDYIDVQMARFSKVLSYLIDQGLSFEQIHMANSAGILTKRSKLKDFGQTFFVRPGLAAFGLDPMHKTNQDLKPVMVIKAQIVAIKKLQKGQGVGYGHSYVGPSEKTVAVVTIGYGDGLRRSLSNHGYMLVNGEKAPIIGTISMDSCTIDISHIEKVGLGDMVTVLGTDGDHSISAWDHANLCGTIPYEILTSISARLTRVKY